MLKTTKKLSLGLLFISLWAVTGCKSGHSKSSTGGLDTIPAIVMQAKRCARLYTTEYRVRKIITHDDQSTLSGKILGQSFSANIPLGKRQIAIPVDATLKAYIDFSGFSSENVHRDGNRIEIVLPDPHVEIISTSIDYNGIRSHVDILRSSFSNDEIADYEQQGRKAIIDNIPNMNIIETAQRSAASTLIPMLCQAGFDEKDITITFRKDLSARHLLSLPASAERKNNP